MYFLLLVLILQAPKEQNQITTPRTNSVAPTVQSNAPIIQHEKIHTTPGLTAETELHLQMEHEIGGQGEAVGTLKEKISNLESKRETIDRPDIESLKSSREHVRWIIAGVAVVLAFTGFFRKFLWDALLRPLRREIFGTTNTD
jgi:hypothetical protein